MMNTAYGEPTAEAMPFDMRHLRNPITYNCPADLGDAERRQVRDQLSEQLESAIRAVLESEESRVASLTLPSHRGLSSVSHWMGTVVSERQMSHLA